MDDYIDEPEVREGIRWSIQTLAMDAAVQLSLFPDFTCNADELVLDFDHWFRVAQQHFPNDVANDRLDALDDKLTAMSYGGPEFDETLWREESLATRPEWQEVRSLAMHAIRQFGWPVEQPPWGRSQYARYNPNPD